MKNTTVPIALPYGTWKIYTGTTLGAKTTLRTGTTVTVLDGVVSVDPGTGAIIPGVLGASAIDAAGIVTLDPRVKN